MFKSTAIAVTLSAFAALASMSAKAQPEITVSIKPVHSLVAGVTRGVAEPYLLMPGSASPHAYSLKPSDAQALERADVVFWVGEDLETFMTRPLEALAGGARVVPLAEAPGLALMDVRAGDDWEAHAHGEEHDHGHGHDHEEEHPHSGEHGHDDADNEKHAHDDHHGHDHGHDAEHGHDDAHGHAHGDKDMHIWLDPENAKAVVAHIVNILSKADPENAPTYQDNGAGMTARLDALMAELRDTLAPVQDKPFLVFHDAYQYLETRFDLSSAGAITLTPGIQPSARRVQEIREKIDSAGATCIFAEPQFEPKIVSAITEGTDARSGVLDPLGADIDAGSDMYFALMRENAEALVRCLCADR